MEAIDLNIHVTDNEDIVETFRNIRDLLMEYEQTMLTNKQSLELAFTQIEKLKNAIGVD